MSQTARTLRRTLKLATDDPREMLALIIDAVEISDPIERAGLTSALASVLHADMPAYEVVNAILDAQTRVN